MSLKLLIVGSMTHSIATYDDGDRERFGGGVSYGGKAASSLGIPTMVITIGAKDIDPGVQSLKSAGINVLRISRNSSNNFSNDYRSDFRKLQMRSYIKEPFSKNYFQEVPESDAVIFFPGLHEISPEVLNIFRDRFVFLDVGGLTRKLGGKNNEGFYPISHGKWKNIDDFRGKVNVLKVSEEDLENTSEKTENLVENGFPIVLLTRGEKPTFLHQKNQQLIKIPTFIVEDGDTAGAGEVFSVSFVYEYLLTKDLVKAVAFGNACASYKIAGEDYNYEKARKRADEILKI